MISAIQVAQGIIGALPPLSSSFLLSLRFRSSLFCLRFYEGVIVRDARAEDERVGDESAKKEGHLI